MARGEGARRWARGRAAEAGRGWSASHLRLDVEPLAQPLGDVKLDGREARHVGAHLSEEIVGHE